MTNFPKSPEGTLMYWAATRPLVNWFTTNKQIAAQILMFLDKAGYTIVKKDAEP